MNFIPLEHLPEVSARIEQFQASLEQLLNKRVVVHIDLGEFICPEELVKDYVLRTFSVSWDDLTGPSRKEEVADARHCYCYLMRRYLNAKYVRLAEELNRDHSSIIHGKMRIAGLLRINDLRIMHVIKGFHALYSEFIPKPSTDEV